MMAPEYYIFTGERVPRHVTHFLIDKSLKFVLDHAFFGHPNIEEVICHDGVIKIGKDAFHNCPRLRRVIMPGVKIIERGALSFCRALNYIECGKLEFIGESAFIGCKSLISINLPSIRIVGRWAFNACTLTSVMFGKKLESIGMQTFHNCASLERIALPLKDGVIINDSTFQRCGKLDRVDLVEGAELSETVDALLLEEWKNDMNAEIEAINQILPNTSAGSPNDGGGKAREIRAWIGSVLLKIIRYKAEHQRYVNEATTTLQLALPNDIVFKNVLPFLELPSYTFEGEN